MFIAHDLLMREVSNQFARACVDHLTQFSFTADPNGFDFVAAYCAM